MRHVNHRVFVVLLLLGLLPAAAAGQVIVRTSSAVEPQVQSDHNLNLVNALSPQNVYLMESAAGNSSQQVVADLSLDSRVQQAEGDVTTSVPEISGGAQLTQSTAAILDVVFDPTPVSYFGSSAPNGYVNQAAAGLIGLTQAQTMFNATGAGVVAIIDTGVDPNHSVLQGVLVPGYDFTRNVAGLPSELADLSPTAAAMLNQSTAAILDQKVVAVLNQSTAAILDQSTAAILDASQLPAAFGHGTMVAGIVHLAAPTARIMPLKAFKTDGTASLFDIIRAVYYAVDNGANVINLSFNLTSGSTEFMRAINYARTHNVLVVTSVGNSANNALVYPAIMKSVFGVASINNQGAISKFSNYGSSIVDLAAPGEAIITTYPGNHYAAAWGTSFSAPFVSGGLSLLEQFWPGLPYAEAAEALTEDRPISVDLGYGTLDLLGSVRLIWRSTMQPGIPLLPVH